MNNRNQAALNTNVRLSSAVTITEQLDIMAIFILFTKTILHKFLEEIGRFFMFPIAAATAIMQTALAWRQVYLDGGKSHGIVKALVETATAAAITVAVIGGLVAGAIFATVSPIIFTATLGAKMLFHAASAFYFWGKSVMATDPVEKDKFKFEAINNGLNTASLALAVTAISLVMVAGKFAFAAFGIASAVLAIGHTIYKTFIHKPMQAAAGGTPGVNNSLSDLNHVPGLTNNAKMHLNLGAQTLPASDEMKNVPVEDKLSELSLPSSTVTEKNDSHIIEINDPTLTDRHSQIENNNESNNTVIPRTP